MQRRFLSFCSRFIVARPCFWTDLFRALSFCAVCLLIFFSSNRPNEWSWGEPLDIYNNTQNQF